jgi:hypothetical protein
MITSDGNVVYNNNTTDLGFPIFNLFISDNDIVPQLGALNAIMAEFYLLYGWSDLMAIGTPAFDLLGTYPS